MRPARVVAAAGLLAACAHAPPAATPVDRLAVWLQGGFDNAAQAREDDHYVPMSVHWRPLWPERTDGRWFLVEQFVATDPDGPYRVRVHRLRDDGSGGVASDVYLLPTDASGRDPAPADIEFDRLEPQPGCTVWLRSVREGFRGATRGKACPSTVAGATYTTAEVLVDAAGFVSWERGFAADGTQVWGLHANPYVFRRTRP